MSKISVTTIAGLTSGGDANKVKIESGDDLQVVSGDTTLGGDLTVDTNTLFVDASTNKVHIGNTSDADTTGLSVVKAGGGNFIANFRNTTAGTPYGVKISAPSGDTAGYPLLVISDHASEEYFKVQNNGLVTKPNNPAFTVRSTGGNNGNTWEAGQDIKFQVVDTDIGSNYSTSTGRFTAPVAGYYTFSYMGFGYTGGRVPAGSTCSVQLRKNGSTVVVLSYNEIASSTGYPQMNSTFSLALAVNDYITIRAHQNGQYADSSGLYTALSGYLVG